MMTLSTGSPRHIPIRFTLSLLTIAILFASSIFVQAQTTVSTGTILGTVIDPSGAVVGGARITITNKATGQVITTSTTSAGTYASGALTPGEYVVRVEAKGFRTSELLLTVQVSAVAPGNVTLEVGRESEVVEVQSTALRVSTEQATVQGVVTAKQIDELPISRNFLDLAQLEPGVQIQDGQTFDPTKNGFSSISIGGRAGRTARIEVDGVDISDENVGTTTQNIAMSSIQEFQIGQSSLDMSSELTSSGTVNVVTRSGTNDFRGDLFGYFRDKRAGGANFPGGQDLPLQRNTFGGRLGGPIINDKMFFFVDYEHFKQDLFSPVVFSDPFGGLSGGYSSPFRETETSGRLDWQILKSARLFYKFTYDNNSAVNSFGGANYQPFLNRDNTPSHVVGLDFTTGSYSHSVRFAYNKFVNGIVDAVTGSSIFDPSPRINLFFNGGSGFASGPNLLAPQATIQSNKEIKYDGTKVWGSHQIRFGFGLNRIAAGGFANFFGLAPQVTSDTSAASENFANTSCGASPCFPGGQSNPLNYPVQSITIGNGQGFFSEKPSFGYPAGGNFDTRVQFYVGDNWKLRPNFTVTYALRYVRDTGRNDNDLSPMLCSQVNTANFSIPPCSGNTQLLDQFGFIKGLGNRGNQPNKNFAPQLGLAWDPFKDGKTVIRAGAGLYYENTVFNNILFDRVIRLEKGLFNAQPADPCATGGVVFPDGTNHTSVDGLDIGSQICNNPVGNVGDAIADLQQQYQTAVTAAGPAANPFFLGQLLDGFGSLIAPNFITPRSVQMNVGFQREVHHGIVLSADYVRNVGTHYLLGVDTNRVGDARFLNANAALNAINATVTGVGCPAASGAGASSQASINCYLSTVPGPSIGDFANNGLDSGGQYLGGLPATLFGLTPDTGAAFPGINPLVGRNTMFFPIGRSVYSGLQTSVKGQIGNPVRGIGGLNLQVSYALSRFVSNVPGGIGDQDFLPTAVDFNNPTKYLGPASQDRRHQISFGTILDLAVGARISFIGHFYSPLPQTLFLPSAAGFVSGEIFRTDVTGDGEYAGQTQTGNSPFGDIMPGTNVGSFGRGISAGGLNGAIDNYVSNFGGALTPAGQALVTAGYFTQSQLISLGAVTPGACPTNFVPTPVQPTCLQHAPAGNVGLDWLRAFDMTFAWPVKITERFKIEPSISIFNVFNFANFDPPNNKLGGILDGAVGDVNGTTVANRTSTRIGVGSGLFAQGAPRQMEFGLKFSF